MIATDIELVGAPVTLWMDEQRLPTRLVVGGRRYAIIDEPSALDFFEPDDRLTHLPAVIPVTAWRFTARELEEGVDVRVFDVEQDGLHWRVTAARI